MRETQDGVIGERDYEDAGAEIVNSISLCKTKDLGNLNSTAIFGVGDLVMAVNFCMN